jgi:hypothetical protein
MLFFRRAVASSRGQPARLTQPGQQEGAVMPDTPGPLNNVIAIEDKQIKSHRSNDAAL